MAKRDSSASSSIRDSIASTSRFSSLLSPSSSSSLNTIISSTTAPPNGARSGATPTTNTFPIPSPSPTPSNTFGNGLNGKRTTMIYDRPISKARGTEVSLGAWAYLLGEIVQYTQKRVSGIGEFEKRLNILGYRIGSRLLELLPLRDHLHPLSSLRSPPPPTRTLRLLPLLTYVHSTLYRYLFNRPADSLEKSTENPDEFMIGDNDMVVTRSVEVPKEMSELSCAALVAGIIEAVLDGAGFPARVTAHSVPTLAHPRKTVILIKLAPEVLEREAALDGK